MYYLTSNDCIHKIFLKSTKCLNTRDMILFTENNRQEDLGKFDKTICIVVLPMIGLQS